MERKYNQNLVEKINQKAYQKQINGINVEIKPIPEDVNDGMMDPRLYADNKKVGLMRFIPKRFMKFEMNPKTIEKLRVMFNGIKSIPITSDKTRITNITIKGKDDNDIPVKIYQPETMDGPRPVLYYIHGGGFFGGHSGVVNEFVKLIVQEFKIVAVSIDYRLAPENPYPKGHEDCFEGLKWIAENIEAYQGNPKQIFVAGDSAGGNLTQYCTTRDLEENTHLVKGQLLLYPTVNMAGIEDEYAHWSLDKYTIHPKHRHVIGGMLGMMGGDTGMSSMMGDILGTTDLNNIYLTPYMMDPKGLPPTFITVGQHDFLFVECLAYAKKLVDANVETTTVVYQGMGHAYADNIGVYPQSENCALEVGKFILAHCQD